MNKKMKSCLHARAPQPGGVTAVADLFDRGRRDWRNRSRRPCFRALVWTTIWLALTGLQSHAQSVYTPYTFTALAGQDQNSHGGGVGGSVDGTGSNAQFRAPAGVAVDSAGNLYVADSGNNTIRKVTVAGTASVVTTLAGNASLTNQGGQHYGGYADGTGTNALFSFPTGVAVDAAGNIYVADTGNCVIRMVAPVDSNWVVTTLAGLAGSYGSADGTGTNARFGFNTGVAGTGPMGVAVDGAGNVYVADTANNTIRKMTRVGTDWLVTTLAGNAIGTSHGIPRPGLGGSADGTGNAAQFGGPAGIAVDAVGNLYVADQINQTIRMVTPAGVVTTLAGLAGNLGNVDGTGTNARFALSEGENELFAPPLLFSFAGVAVDRVGGVYVADYYNSAIRKAIRVGTNWAVTTLGLAGGQGGAGGAAGAVSFSYPSGIAVDAAGRLYAAELGNNVVREGIAALTLFAPDRNFGLETGSFGFGLTGPPGQSVVVEASTDLATWLPVWTNTLAGDLGFSDPESASFPIRFYRARAP